MLNTEKNPAYLQENPNDFRSLVREAARALGYKVIEDTSGDSKTQESATELKDENALADLDAIVTSLADAVLVFDANGNVRFLNSAAEKFFGHSSDSLTDSLFHKPVLWQIEESGKPSSPFSRECLYQVIKEGRSMVTEVVNLQSPDSPQWLLANLSPVLQEDRTAKGAVLALTDITSVKKKKNQRTDHLKEVFNELKTPITVIRGHAQILAENLRSSSSPSPGEEQIEAILSSIDRIERILSDLVTPDGKST